jgi:hypothetical protein
VSLIRGENMRNFMIAAMAALAFASTAGAAPNCTKGVACGNTCIAKGKVCHITTTTKTAVATTTTTTTAKATNHCKNAKGKFVKCGTPGAVPA